MLECLRAWTDRRAAGLSSAWPRPAWPAPYRPAAASRARSAAGGRSAAGRPGVAQPGAGERAAGHLGLGDPPPRRASTRSRGTPGKASVLSGESFPLFVSTTARAFTVDRLPARLVPGARRAPGVEVEDGPRRRAARRDGVRRHQHRRHRLGPGAPGAHRRLAGRGLPAQAGRRVRRAAVRAGHRPVAVLRGQGRAQEPACRPGRRTTPGAATTCTRGRAARTPTGRSWSALTAPTTTTAPTCSSPTSGTWSSSPSTSPWKRAASTSAYVTSMDIAADPRLLDGASALVSLGHDEYWTPQERANVTAARDTGRQPGLPRRERAVPPDPAAGAAGRRRPPGGLLQDRLRAGPGVREGPDARSPATGASRRTPTRSPR